MTEKYLGKISSVSFGKGGYQDCMFGLTLSFEMSGGGISAFINGGWTLERSPDAKWTEEDRSRQQAEMVKKMIQIMKDAKVDEVYKLKGIPVEVTVENMTFKDFRILKEVL